MASPGLLGHQLDRYHVESLLGTGSFSAVYRARHVHTGAPVALKVLKKRLEASGDETIVERFLREARAAATVGSEHIVQVIDAGRADELTFLALEFLEGTPLDALVKQGPLAVSRALELTNQVLDGLEATHRAGIIHRDMKPANVFVLQRGGRDFVKLLDFGISKIHADDVRALTMTGVAMGTPSYMAPEQFFDARSVDERADLYSVAVMLYELLSGRKPLVSGSYAEAVMKVRSEIPTPLTVIVPAVPKALADVVAKGLSKAKEDRWQTAAAFKQALRGVLDDGTQKTFMRPQPPAEARTILETQQPAIHAWQAATLIDAIAPAAMATPAATPQPVAQPEPTLPPKPAFEPEPRAHQPISKASAMESTPSAIREREPTIPPEAAAFLKPVVPRWVWWVAAVLVAIGVGALLASGSNPPRTDEPPASPAKLKEDEDALPPPPPSQPLPRVTEPATKKTRR